MALSDEAVIAGMASGDTDAMAVFVRRYQARVYGLALAVVADAGLAEEVAQDAFMRVWRHAGAYDPRRGRVPTWLLTITRNLAVDAVRLRRDRPVDPEQLVGALADEATEPDPDSAERLWAGLRTLPADQARPIVMAIVYGLTAKEIAATEGIPLGTAKTRIRRGLARLRVALAAGEPGSTAGPGPSTGPARTCRP
ncbi:MAG TPA: sigma-70 family RNA polymerase sigma factor [Micromonosporaceae bacterium]|nr:sigma-70 family RNA polymerase sigma factor [Micromonosporaceae bacterium]